MSGMCSIRLKGAALIILLPMLAASCKRESQDRGGALTASLIFDNASPELREALSSPVDFIIDDDNFAHWEEAQNNLDDVPRSDIPAISLAWGNPVDRAVARLESSPLARRAIESAALSVREFVLATIALAQASEAAQTGRSMSRGPIPPENLEFAQRYYARVLRSRSESRMARAGTEGYDVPSETSERMAEEIEMQIQMQLDRAEHAAEMQAAEAEMRREEAERAAEMQIEQAQRAAELQIERAQHEAEMRRDTVPIR
jgi:hypothetical protein